MDDKKLVKQLGRKNEKALAALIERYSAYVSTVIRNAARGVLDENDVEEIAADVFIKLWKNSGQLRAETLRQYLAVIARNLTIDRLRVKRFSVPLDEIKTDAGTGIEYDAEHRLLAEALNRTISEMEPRDRELLLRFYFYYQSLPEIAEAMDMGKSACTTALNRARNKLKQKLTERGYGDET